MLFVATGNLDSGNTCLAEVEKVPVFLEHPNDRYDRQGTPCRDSMRC